MLEPRIDLVLLDIGMPVMGGREAFEQIRQLRPRLPIVVSSGYGSLEAQRLPASAERQAGFIPKPWASEKVSLYPERSGPWALRMRWR